MRRALLSVGASASAISCAALAGQSRVAQAAGAEEAPKYGFEGHKVNYGGAGDVKPSNREKTKRIVSHMSTVPDEWELFRIATRASIILDKLNEADAEIVKRPETLKVKALEGVDLTSMVDKACHRQCVIEWKAYAQCSQKKSAGVRAALTNPDAPHHVTHPPARPPARPPVTHVPRPVPRRATTGAPAGGNATSTRSRNART